MLRFLRRLFHTHAFYGSRWLSLAGAVWLEQECSCGKKRQTITKLTY